MSVSWTPPSEGSQPTGYMIYYEATAGVFDVGSVTVSGGSTSQYRITVHDLVSHVFAAGVAEYTVKIVTLSAELPSTMAETTSIRGESNC